MGGTARVSVVVTEEWRARALLAEFAARGVTGSQVASADGRIGVRTAFSAVLAPIAARWLKGAVTAPPEEFTLTGPMLRLWYIAGRAGRPRTRPAGGRCAPPSRSSACPPLCWGYARAGRRTA